MGAMQPFFRAHAHHDSKRREPWVFGEPHTSHLRKAVTARYALLPYFYTLFDTHQETGRAVMLPLWYMYPQDQSTFAMEDQFLAGTDLLVKPVLHAGQTSTDVYLPGQEPWYDVDTFVGYAPNGGNILTMETPIDKMPVFQRGGSIIPRQLRVRRSSSLMAKDPYTLFVALDSKGEASGELYVDDGHSFDYQKGDYIRRRFSFSNGRLSASTSTLKVLPPSPPSFLTNHILPFSSSALPIPIIDQSYSTSFSTPPPPSFP
jgi:alpha 1,3-glucosidase